MSEILNTLNNHVWGMGLVLMVLLTGLYYSFKMKFPQFRRFKLLVKSSSKGGDTEKGLNQLQSFIFTAARTVGVGNIAGMATGIHFGGPGAIFWLWILALVGSPIAMIEGIMSQAYKKEVRGEYRGGPAYYMEKGFKNKKVGNVFAKFYAVVGVFAVTLLMPGVQTYNIVKGINLAFNFNVVIVGLIFSIVFGLIIIGGLRRIGNVAQRVSPFMAIAYFSMSLIVIFFNITKLPATLALIIKSAFGKDAVFGAMVGQAVIWGIKRGVFANEVGVGSSAITSASADVDHPVTQGMIGGLSVFMGTFFICTTSALMMIITDSYNTVDKLGNFVVENLPGVEYGNAYVIDAINSCLPGIGEAFIAISVLCFSSVALLAYYLYAESDLIFLVGDREKPILILKIVFVISIFLGCLNDVDTVWTMGDMAHGLMAWINVFTLIFIGNQAVKIFKDYEEQEKLNIKPVFDPDKLGIHEASDVWRNK
ncbi:alanine/glycine:cation symporter family protein [Peptoniphilus obesi]|uniref:alanine/glycine:cation symporter family protein n=1 Tax=Peptoniphilus obesi TaxID=1472765 RepID=UPI0004ADD879|nr:alanine/glycine:cation symporter family protein [Peptoniphilus obesi]